jgi:hypothetical protein
VVFKSILQNDLDPAHFVQENISGELDFVLEKPASFQQGETDKEKKIASDRELEEIIRLVMQLRQTQVNGLISQLRFLQSNQEELPEKQEIASQQQNFMKLIKVRGLLDKALAKPMFLN